VKSTNFHIGNCFVGSGFGYIYILYTKAERRLYIGQTNDQCGVIGRLAEHVGPRGTLRARLYDEGLHLNEIEDLQVFAYRLPNDLRYVGADRAHREGVEHLVQKRLHALRGDLTPPMKIVSYVRYNPAAELPDVKHVADQLIIAFVNEYAVI
jgi:hypothetical protein